ncbi:class I SAM-dependent methyltransferase [Pseudokineococcus sp. 1T1Z-3]|uniref:class I SAM-dependent methyltransferase n=1 Tax=Pseudokineococcus sp. 1T1Z-3 TaxID=3132745 RepID=UPI0030ACB426
MSGGEADLHHARTVAGYDAVAADYARLVPDLAGEQALDLAMLSTFVELLRREDAPAGQVVDVGCGTGRVTAHLAEQGLDVLGLDPSPGMLTQARAASPHLRFAEGDVRRLDLPDASCAGTLSWYALLHLPPESLPRAVAELARVLRPGGLLLLGFHVGEGHRTITGAYGRPVHLDAWDLTPERALDLTSAAGLDVVARLVRAPAGRERREQASLLHRKPW